ncbi:hypothetical protein FOZ63_031184 [Perkinsus olseni]|uniref:Uncharacterized protein n=1 Tax=Perkinsus olseni TaxID=32597 RepID=A0A7J6T7P7_PEROL|nr:hypothetical protein FOZ63_031184 [Perkinsus olseni]
MSLSLAISVLVKPNRKGPVNRCSCLEHRDDLPPAPTLSVLFILFKMSRYAPAYSRFAHLSPQPGWEVTSLYRPEVLFAQSGNTTYFLLPWREAVEVKPEPINWTVVNDVKFAPLEFQYTQSHLHVDPVREAGVFEYLEGDTTYYEVQLSHRGRSEFESAARKSYTFDEEGKLSPLHNNPDSVWEADALRALL